MNAFCGNETHHGPHSWGDLNWCQGWIIPGMSPVGDEALLADLDKALVANGAKKVCPACDVIENASESVRGPLADALAGTIGRDKLVLILRAHGHDVSRRVIQRHRQEGHMS